MIKLSPPCDFIFLLQRYLSFRDFATFVNGVTFLFVMILNLLVNIMNRIFH